MKSKRIPAAVTIAVALAVLGGRAMSAQDTGHAKYNAASDTFTPASTADEPPQANDAKCGLACHTIVKARDYVFTDYGKR